MARVSSNFRVRYCEVSYAGVATPVSLLNYLQETAFDHLDRIGSSPEALAANNETWMIYKWYVRIYKYPLWKQIITVSTWLSNFRSREVRREFKIHSDSGELLANATALAILVDTRKGTPKKISLEERELWEPDTQRATNYTFERFDMDNAAQWQKRFLVRYSDIDSNSHVNNARYLAWFLENVPFETHMNFFLNELEIVYRHQIKYGEEVTVSTAQMDDKGKIVCVGKVEGKEGKAAAILRAGFIAR